MTGPHSTSQDNILERRFFPAGSLIIQEGDPGYAAYLVQSGSVHVFSRDDKTKVSLAWLGPGEIFGEMALLSDEPCTASVEAIDDCNLVVISRQLFLRKLNGSDRTIQAMLKMLTSRVVDANSAVINSVHSIRDLEETIQVTFSNVLENMPEEQKKSFRDAVLPEINRLLEALQSFRDESELTASRKDHNS